MEAYEALSEYYGRYDEDSRLVLQHGRVEFTTTVTYIEKYLRHGMKILEIGAGTGRYSHYFARNGYSVDAVELIPSNIQKFNENTKPNENVRIFEGNATNLGFLKPNKYDIVLLLGPMYHLFTKDEQKKALSEAKSMLVSGGILFTSYCMTDATVVGFCFGKNGIRDERYKNLIDTDTFKLYSTPQELFVLMRQDDIFALTESLGMERLHFIGTDMYTNYFREMVDSMDDEMFDLWIKYTLSICERGDLVGISHHALDVLKLPK